MSEQATSTVRRSITVEATPERAFAVFTAGFEQLVADREPPHRRAGRGRGDPRAAHRRPLVRAAADGSECDWGAVIAWEPPSRLLLAWQLTPEWEYDPDPANATEVEVTFTPEGDGTRVELEHRGFEKHGEAGAKMRELVSAPGGWNDLLQMFAKEATYRVRFRTGCPGRPSRGCQATHAGEADSGVIGEPAGGDWRRGWTVSGRADF